MTGAGARAGTRIRASRTTLRIFCKSFLKYLGTLVAAAEDSGPGGLLGCSENSDLRGREELGEVTGKGGVTKRYSRRRQPRPYTEVILALVFF